MRMPHTKRRSSAQVLSVYRADDVFVSNGVAEGEGLSFADELVFDDVYQIKPSATRHRLALHIDGSISKMAVGAGSDMGKAGNALYLDCIITFMASDGSTHEGIVIVEVEDGGVEDIFFMPLSQMSAQADYRLVGVSRDDALTRFAEMSCVSFAKGTHITLGSGEQRKIEDLKVGDKVLTRDDGQQEIRWIGQNTLRATGEFAPVLIKAGTLHNTNDLILSPDHRIFVYQREDRLGAGRSELLVRARHLINGDTVQQIDGGYIDYFQLLFDDHQIIYAEGIAAESLLLDERTRHALPKTAEAYRHAHRHHMDYEVQEKLLKSANAADLLRSASTR